MDDYDYQVQAYQAYWAIEDDEQREREQRQAQRTSHLLLFEES